MLQKKDGITVNQAKALYNMNFDGWTSSCMRDRLLWGECAGNFEHKHFFTYFGTPETYKVVIMNNSTGETRITDVIHRTDFDSEITIDVNTMKTVNSINFLNILKTIAISLVLTLVVEIVIALIMKINNLKIIVITNIITNIILQLILMIIPLPYMFKFISMEILVIISEYLIYKKYFNDVPDKKLIIYVFVANLISALLTFLVR